MQQYQKPLYKHVFRLIGQHDDTDDVLQNVFVKVFRHIQTFEGQSALFTWLYRIATNEALTFLAQHKKRATAPLDNHEAVAPSALAESTHIEAALAKAIAQLPDKQRVVFNLRYYEEMPYETMSAVLDTSVGALKATYHHAVKKIEAFFKNTTV